MSFFAERETHQIVQRAGGAFMRLRGSCYDRHGGDIGPNIEPGRMMTKKQIEALIADLKASIGMSS